MTETEIKAGGAGGADARRRPRRAGRGPSKFLGLAVLALVLVVAAVIAVTRPPSGHLLAVADFETGDFSQWTEVQSVDEERYDVVESLSRQGDFAGRFESVEGECIPMDCGDSPRGRTEALLKGEQHDVEEGDDVWYRWYTMFPEGGATPEFTFAQWRSNDEQSSPLAKDGLYGLMTVGRSDSQPEGYIAFQRNGDRWTAPLRRGEWIEFVVHIKYSSDPDVGLYELWVDDRLVVSFNDQSKPGNTGVYFKQGVYRNGDTPSAVVYSDGLRIASTRELADPGWVDRLLGRDERVERSSDSSED